MEKIDELSDIVTLEKLAADGRFISVDHNLPRDYQSLTFKVSHNGKVIFCNIDGEDREQKIFIIEVYASETMGWIVGYMPGKLGCEVVLKGNVEIVTGL